MARRSPDIPIRPRYGYVDETRVVEHSEKVDDTSEDDTASPPQSTLANHRLMASSYSEIPFLAQYSGASDHNDATTPTTHKQLSATAAADSLDGDEDYVEENDSKSSSCEARQMPKRPDSLQYVDSSIPYELEGSVRHEGKMMHFVANNLEHTLKIASPESKTDQAAATNYSHTSTPSTSAGLLTRHFLQTRLPQIDSNVLNDIEIEAQYLAASVDNLTENLCNLLHSISSITADNVEVHKNAVNKLTDSMDANIKCMYTIMAKTEEISKSMKPTEKLGQRIREIKRLVDMLESNM